VVIHRRISYVRAYITPNRTDRAKFHFAPSRGRRNSSTIEMADASQRRLTEAMQCCLGAFPLASTELYVRHEGAKSSAPIDRPQSADKFRLIPSPVVSIAAPHRQNDFGRPARLWEPKKDAEVDLA
jgi:hypothetical protein